MPTYVVLYTFTEKGRAHIKDTVRRSAEIRKENEAKGFKGLGHYWTQGEFDLVSVVEAPNENAMLAGLFNIARAGNVVSHTLRAFTDGEMTKTLGT
ncbi:MAG: GYD domain-containing protein [Chloroflexi bacterium]|nr:GYD domain-containing protein [Chloroflexota bacterium]